MTDTAVAIPAAEPIVVSRPLPQVTRWLPHVVTGAVLTCLAIAVTWPVWVTIFRYALRDEEQSHSFLAVPVAVWLLWIHRIRLEAVQPRWDLLGLGVIAAGWGLATAGFQNSIDLALGLGSLFIVLGGIQTAVGTRVLMRVWPAVVVLLALLPVPGRLRRIIAAPLQEWSAQVAQFGLEMFGIPALRSGNVLTVNGVDVAIAEACNGMRMVSALALITFVFVFSSPLRPLVRLALLLICPLIALAVNVIRLVPTALVYGYQSPATAEAFHDWSGWGVLLLAILILFGIVSLLRWLELPIEKRSSRDLHQGNVATPGRSDRWLRAAPVAAIALMASIFAMGGFEARPTPGLLEYHAKVRESFDSIPYRVGGALGVDQQVSPGVIRLLKPNAIVQRDYRDPLTGQGFGLVVVHCSDARHLVDHYPPICYPSAGWTAGETIDRTFELEGLSIPARIYDFTRQTQRGPLATRVVSFFVVPSAESSIVSTMDAVARASRSTRGTALGAAHIMVSFPNAADDDTIADTVSEVLEQLEPTIRTTAGGPVRE